MEEKIIIRSTPFVTLKTLLIFVIVGALLGIMVASLFSAGERADRLSEAEPIFEQYESLIETYKDAKKKEQRGEELDYYEETILSYSTASKYAISRFYFDYERNILEEYASPEDYASAGAAPYIAVGIGLAFTISFFGLIYYLLLRSLQVTVTDKRVYGHTGWFRDISIPLYAVTGVSTLPFRGFIVGSASVKIPLFWVRNYKAMYKTLNELLMNAPVPSVAPTAPIAPVAPIAPAASAPTAPAATAPTARTSIAPEAPNNLPPQVAMQAAVQSAVQASNNPAPELPTPGKPTAPSPAASPAASPAVTTGGTQIGKCTICGKANVPVTTVSVNVAGRVRVRHFCDECNAKR